MGKIIKKMTWNSKEGRLGESLESAVWKRQGSEDVWPSPQIWNSGAGVGEGGRCLRLYTRNPPETTGNMLKVFR